MDTCNLLSFSMNLDYTGGDFSLVSTLPITGSTVVDQNLGAQTSVFGMTGAITKFGKKLSNSQFGYRTDGILGPVLVHRNLNLLVTSIPLMQQLINQQTLRRSDPNGWTTYGGLATALAQAAKCNLLWAVPDYPYFETFSIEGQTALSAMASLATQVGATLRWDGNSFYTVEYPNRTRGAWVVPDQYLITAGGVEYDYFLDLETGIGGTGLLGSIVYYTFDPTVKLQAPGPISRIPAGGTNQPTGSLPIPIQTVFSTTSPFDPNSPTNWINLPLDFDTAWVQVLCNTGSGNPPGAGAGGGYDSFGSGGGTLNASQFSTTDPNQWFSVGDASITNKYVRINTSFGTYQPQFRADYTNFPFLSSVNNGNFTLNIGVSKVSLQDQFNKAAKEEQAIQKQNVARTIGQFTYVKTYEATINCIFFGSIPMPGMMASVTVCGTTISGVIESVQFSLPGTITVKIAKYARIQWINQNINLTVPQTPGMQV